MLAEIICLLILVIIFQFINYLKLDTMGKELDAVKQQLKDASEKTDKIAADVQRLHDIISGAGETPTPEEWAEVKALGEALNAKLQNVDDQTPE